MHTSHIYAVVASQLLLAGFGGTAARAQCGPQWLPGDGIPLLNGRVLSAIVWDRDGAGPQPARLVVGGEFTRAGSPTALKIAMWDGLAWSPLGSGMNGGVSALAVLQNGDLVAGGAFTNAGGVSAKYVARWNGAAWSALGSGMSDGVNATSVLSLAVLQNGDLIAGGRFGSAGGVTVGAIARWNGTAWSALGTGMRSPPGFAVLVYSLAVLANGDLVAGGQFTLAGGTSAMRIARWDGSTWSALGPGMDGPVLSMVALADGKLIAGGFFIYAGTAATTPIASWDGTSWSSLDTGISRTFFDPVVYALTVLPNDRLVAAGAFGYAGGNPVEDIACWDGADWSAMPGPGFGTDPDAVTTLTVLPNGELVAMVNFTHTDGSKWASVERWTKNPVPWIARQPHGKTVCKGSDFTTFAIPAVGYSGVSYQWRRNGVNIVDGPAGASANGGTVSGASGVLPSPTDGTAATLGISGPQVSDPGEYSVVFSTSCGSVTSAPATLIVCPADYNCDGYLDPLDYNGFINAFEAGDMSADFNDDSFLEPTDYSLFINAFEAGC